MHGQPPPSLPAGIHAFILSGLLHHPCMRTRQIHGIWFYDEDDLLRLSSLLHRVKSGLPKTDILPSDEAATAPEVRAAGTTGAVQSEQRDN